MSFQNKEPEKKSRFRRLKEAFAKPDPTERIREAGVIAKESGFIPWFKIGSVEQRRKEIIDVMVELNNLEFNIIRKANSIAEIQKMEQSFTLNTYKLAKLFQLYFITGSPWVCGVDNESLSKAVSCFIENFEDVGDIPGAYRDLHAEMMNLLHLSWSGKEVTQTPPYITQMNNVPTNQHQQLPYGYGPSQSPQNTEG